MNNENSSVLRKELMSGSLIVAVATFCGYLFAFIYETSYQGYFSIPFSLVELNTAIVFSAVFITAFLLFSSIYFIGMCLQGLVSISRIRRIIYGVIGIAVILLSKIALSGVWEGLTLLWQLFGIVLVVESVVSILIMCGKGEKNTDLMKGKEDIENRVAIIIDMSKRFGKRRETFIVVMPAILFLSLALPIHFGKINARRQKEFLVLETNSNPNYNRLAVIRAYTDRLICVPVKEGRFLKQIIVLPTIQNNVSTPQVLVWEKIGPLKPCE